MEEKTFKDNFVEEMTGESNEQISLDKFLKKTLNSIKKECTKKNLSCLMALGNFSDLNNPVISTGGITSDIKSTAMSGILLMRMLEIYIANTLLLDIKEDREFLELFLQSLKELSCQNVENLKVKRE